MSTAERRELISVEDYLAGELVSRVKHEYLGGVVYAMSGARNVHNRIATNVVVAIGARLRGKRCQPFNSDTKIRIRLPSQTLPSTAARMGLKRPFRMRQWWLWKCFRNRPGVRTPGEQREAYLTISSFSSLAV